MDMYFEEEGKGAEEMGKRKKEHMGNGKEKV